MRRSDKYNLYERSVQNPEAECKFSLRVYKKFRKRRPVSLREDFCGTFLNAIAWVKSHPENVAHGLDLDSNPIAYGFKHHYTEMKPEQQKRLHIHQMNVCDPKTPQSDIIMALNFSWMTFQTRKALKTYFANCYKKLHRNGIFILDFFGGSESQEENLSKEKIENFTYLWEQHDFDPITHRARFSIHFKERGKNKIKHAFRYDWRLWTIPEVRDLLHEVGFTSTHIFWEGDDEDGEAGNGIFTERKTGETCESWVAYVVACR